MGIFKNALQTLSDVAIQESGVTLPEVAKTTLLEEVKSSLDNYPTLTAEECRFDVKMVPVKSNNRLGKYLIEMEDLSRYMITNQVTSIREAVNNILECNDIADQYINVALVVDEASILDEMDQLGATIAGDFPTPQPGLGETIFGAQDNFKNIRRIANTKELLDILYNKYGLPVVKKNYNQVGLLKEEMETAPVKADQDAKVLNEKKPNGQSVIETKNNMSGAQHISGPFKSDSGPVTMSRQLSGNTAGNGSNNKPAAAPTPPSTKAPVQTSANATSSTTPSSGAASNTSGSIPGGSKKPIGEDAHALRIQRMKELLTW